MGRNRKHGRDASIRPRRWSRGDAKSRPNEALNTASFNSATTLESWRPLVSSAHARAASKASIRPRRWSRGDLKSTVGGLQAIGASIRPRRWSRGDGGICVARLHSSTRFNSATTLESWRPSNENGSTIGHTLLQFGHDVGVVETPALRTELNTHSPLQFGHDVGVVETGVDLAAAGVTAEASIRPRRWSRGDALFFRCRAAASSGLQFGHDVGVVETSSGGRRVSPWELSFNSATTLESWRRRDGKTSENR